ncbi:MAG TPA: tetratricopeptide repeat protein [Polyangia bacterium]|jgi:tetratricopeptide (TPR) repeat protein|nr:tetratricopeptide repeat protein [Polyangia bacterium]
MGYGQLRSEKLCAEGRFEEAVTVAAAEIAAEPLEPEPYFHRGQALAALERFPEAAAEYQKALSMDASASALDLEAVDDELFFVLRRHAESLAAPSAVAALRRYLEVLPAGRHVEDVAKWIDAFEGRQPVWYRERA